MNADTIWQQTLPILQEKINTPDFQIMIKRITTAGCDDTTLRLLLPSVMPMEKFTSYRPLIREAVNSATGLDLDIEASVNSGASTQGNGQTRGAEAALQSQAPASPYFTIPQHRPSARPVSAGARSQTYLNPRYTFDNFVVGAGNRLCHAAALAVAEAPGRAYNPLFIYGGVGLGKTHLMQAVGHYIQATRPNLRIQNITTEAFVSDVVTSTKENRLFDFSNQFRNTDLLMVDDIQYLENKERTQDIFFQAFNHLHEAQKQIIVTCDRLPKDIPTLTERLKSRLGNGLIADINAPDFETRLAILQKKLEADRFDMPEGVLDLIASTIKTNIRDLEGALNRIEFHSQLYGQEITLEFVQKIIKDIAPAENAGPASPEKIIAIVSRYYGIPVDEMKGRCRKKEIVLARHIAMYLIRDMTDMTLKAIGDMFSKDHSSVLTSFDKIKNESERDAELRRILDELRTRIDQA